jgi:hypothetical protein
MADHFVNSPLNPLGRFNNLIGRHAAPGRNSRKYSERIPQAYAANDTVGARKSGVSLVIINSVFLSLSAAIVQFLPLRVK